jgi:hypothetical protein
MSDSGRWQSLPTKVRLGAEIVRATMRVRRVVRKNDLPAAVTRCRSEERQHASGALRSDVVRVSRAVRQVVGVLPGDSRPLVSSLVLIAVLARRGVDASLVIGVRDGEGFGPARGWSSTRRPRVL